MDAPEPTVAATEAPPYSSPPKRTAGLVRYPKGHQPEHLRKHQEDPERILKTKRTLMAELTRVLHKRDGALLADLAESIVKNAIKGNAACLSFLAERLAPVEQRSDGGRIVFEGIRLEVVGPGDGQRTTATLVRGLGQDGPDVGEPRRTVALVRGTESHNGTPTLEMAGTHASVPESHEEHVSVPVATESVRIIDHPKSS